MGLESFLNSVEPIIDDRRNDAGFYTLYLKDLKFLPNSIMLVNRHEGSKGTGSYNAVETFRVSDYLNNEICEIRNRGRYHTVYVYENEDGFMYIKKKQKEREAYRICTEQDIPQDLSDTIWREADHLVYICAEGTYVSDFGKVFGVDRNAPTETGKGVWPLDSDSYVEKGGRFYTNPHILEAEEILTTPFSVKYHGRIQTLSSGQSGWLITKHNGEQYILNADTSSREDYYVCDEEGNYICDL